MSRVLALVPARKGSKGIPGKNLRLLAGKSPMQRAAECAISAGCDWVEVSTDHTMPELFAAGLPSHMSVGHRPAELCSDEAPMIDVVQHFLAVMPLIPGEPDDIILLVQPTQPLRKPEHLTAAIALLQESGADSVVSVVELPLTHSPEVVCQIYCDRLIPWPEDEGYGEVTLEFSGQPQRRQDARPAYVRDGTVYAFWRRTVTRHGSLYGNDVRPLIIPASESCPLDTTEDWLEAERRLRATT